MEKYGPSLLLRVFFETADGGYYSPYFEKCYEALPIPDFLGKFHNVDYALNFVYDKIPCRCGRCKLSKYLPLDYVLVGGSSYGVNQIVAHWDPRLDIGVYSDFWRSGGGRIPRTFRECENDCYLFFAAGLAKYPPKFFSRKKGFTEIRRTFMRVERGIYVVAYMKIDKVIDITQFASKLDINIRKEGTAKIWEEAVKIYGEKITMTPHYARIGDLPVVILAEKGNYGFFEQPIPLIEWVGQRKILSNYSYMFGIKKLDDKVRQKSFSPRETEEIIKTLTRKDYL